MNYIIYSANFEVCGVLKDSQRDHYLYISMQNLKNNIQNSKPIFCENPLSNP